jgi:hypothetical protein
MVIFITLNIIDIKEHRATYIVVNYPFAGWDVQN